jgi:uncharacterized protein (DUF433 family)
MRCGAISDWARKPHVARVKLALAVAAHADPALDAFFKPLGPCQVCGTPGLDQRHRVVDAIAEALAAGEITEEISAELDVTFEAIQAVREWAARWPGAWLLAAAPDGDGSLAASDFLRVDFQPRPPCPGAGPPGHCAFRGEVATGDND